VLRTVPEKWLAPAPGGLVERAIGSDREAALFLDQMAGGRLAIGFDQDLQPIYGDFMNGVQGGHVSISGISGVAAKTSYALFLLYMMLESEHGRALLGPAAAQTRALVFNVKGEDLLHLDKPHRGLTDEHREHWAALGIPGPGPFQSADFFVPPAPGGEETDQLVSSAQSRQDAAIYGWTPERFIRDGLLRFCFTDADDRGTQVGFVEQVVRAELAGHAYPLENAPGAVVICDDPHSSSKTFERIVSHVGDRYLAPESRLSPEQHMIMRRLGWSRSLSDSELRHIGLQSTGPYAWCSGNWWLEYGVTEVDWLARAAELSIRTLVEAYRAPGPLRISSAEGDLHV
jgi:hypothetical protein